ncbi:hypothetical protein CD928_05710 [Sphingopyxis sp. GW247-27LB]|nr:hypothetical protein CD928_05710 [Sphingopyxis sp. GW247-27LB]
MKLDVLHIDVLLSGPQGCGKTRFANELVDWADSRGFIVRRTADGVTIQDAGGSIDAPVFNVVEVQS